MEVRRRLDAAVLYARQLGADDAEGAVQEAFLRLWERICTDDPPPNCTAWLFRVIRNLVADQARRKRRTDTAAQRLAFERPAWFESEMSAAEQNDQSRTVENALKQLDADEREVVTAKIWGELTFDEIAELTGVPKSTVFDRYHKALKKLRIALN